MKPRPKLRSVPNDAEPPIERVLPYKRGETAAEIAERIRKGIRREPMVQRIA